MRIIASEIEGKFQVFQRFPVSKLWLKSVESCFVALNYHENGSNENGTCTLLSPIECRCSAHTHTHTCLLRFEFRPKHHVHVILFQAEQVNHNDRRVARTASLYGVVLLPVEKLVHVTHICVCASSLLGSSSRSRSCSCSCSCSCKTTSKLKIFACHVSLSGSPGRR